MVCRRCQRKFRDRTDGVCPFCGEVNPAAASGIMKTSTILISEGRTDSVYRSVSEVPSTLRRRLLKSTSGMNSATILIADRRGKEELGKAIRRLPGNAQQKLLSALLGPGPEPGWLHWMKPRRRTLFVSLLLALISFVVWFTITHR